MCRTTAVVRVPLLHSNASSNLFYSIGWNPTYISAAEIILTAMTFKPPDRLLRIFCLELKPSRPRFLCTDELQPMWSTTESYQVERGWEGEGSSLPFLVLEATLGKGGAAQTSMQLTELDGRWAERLTCIAGSIVEQGRIQYSACRTETGSSKVTLFFLESSLTQRMWLRKGSTDSEPEDLTQRGFRPTGGPPRFNQKLLLIPSGRLSEAQRDGTMWGLDRPQTTSGGNGETFGVTPGGPAMDFISYSFLHPEGFVGMGSSLMQKCTPDLYRHFKKLRFVMPHCRKLEAFKRRTEATEETRDGRLQSPWSIMSTVFTGQFQTLSLIY